MYSNHRFNHKHVVRLEPKVKEVKQRKHCPRHCLHSELTGLDNEASLDKKISGFSVHMIVDRHSVFKNFYSEERIKKDADSYAIRVPGPE